MAEIVVEPLDKETFSEFGDVIETEGAESYPINDGLCTRFHDLAAVDVLADGGRPLINIFRTQIWPFPFYIKLLERHPLSSQAFIPMSQGQFLVVVAPPDDAVAADTVRAFLANGNQGVNYYAGVWHHPLVALTNEADFLVIDRGGEGENCDFYHFEEQERPWLQFSPII